jgi:hypothetical protein
MIKRIREHVKSLNAKTLTSTVLLPYLSANKSLIIDTNNIGAVRCHIKTAIARERKFKTFRIVHPEELVSLSIHNSPAVENVDLLIIECPSFPYYEAAGRRHEYTLSVRGSKGKPTWFVVNGWRTLKDRLPSNLMTILNQYLLGTGGGPVIINAADTLKLFKDKTEEKVQVDTNKGCGLIGVRPKLLEFQVEINDRLFGAGEEDV